MSTKSIPSIFELNKLFFDENACISFLFENEIFYDAISCPSCNSPMNLFLEEERFRCGKKLCRKSVSIRNSSFFAGHKLPTSKVLFLGYSWLSKVPVNSILSMSGCGKATVCSLQKSFRQLVANALTNEDCVIGGDGIVVEIDESKLGKRKYHRGHPVEGVWVVGGVERTDEGKVFLVEVENRSAETLRNIITTYVRPGSIIYTDMWKGYNGLDNGPYEHATVNHSLHFKDPITGVHTNTIEGTWNGLKMQIKPRNRVKGSIDEHLWEFIWRKINKDTLWDSFIHALKIAYYE